MNHNNIIYAILILFIIIIIIYINKKIYLEGYTYNNNLSFNLAQNETPLVSFSDVHESTCNTNCDSLSNCTGYTSNIIKGTNTLGTCTLYNHSKNDTRHIDGTNFYTK